MPNYIEAFRSVVKELMAEQAAAAQKPGADPNEERFAKIEESIARGRQKGYEFEGQRFARLTRAYLIGGENPSGMMDHLNRWGNKDIVADMERLLSNETTRSLAFNGPTGAGLLVPEEYSDELIPLLRPYSVLASVALRHVSLAYGTLHFPRISSGSISYWRPPQGDNKKAGTPGFGRLTLSEKSLTAVSILPTRLLETPGVRADQFVLMDMLAGIGTNMDYGHIGGKGDEFEPLGLLNYPTTDVGPVNTYTGGALASGVLDWTLPIKMVEKHITANGTLVRPGWVMHPTLWRLLMTATTGSAGFLAWLTEMSTNKTILGIPFNYSIYVPVSASANNPTSLILVDYLEYLLATATNMRVSRSTEATVYDSAGNAYHLWPNNDTGIKCNWSGDMGLRQTTSCTIGKSIQTT